LLSLWGSLGLLGWDLVLTLDFGHWTNLLDREVVGSGKDLGRRTLDFGLSFSLCSLPAL